MTRDRLPGWRARGRSPLPAPERSPLVVCLGEALIDFVATETGVEIGQAKTFVKSPGGAIANVAIGLARLGVASRLIAKIGSDPFGKFLLDFLARERVDTSSLLVSEKYPTGLVFVALDHQRVPRFYFFGDPSADLTLSPAEIREEAFFGASFFHLGTVSMVREACREATFTAVRLARKYGVKLSFDPNFRFHLWKDRELVKRLAWQTIRQSALVKLSEEELWFLTGTRDLKRGVRKIKAAGPAAVVVTRGPAGAAYLGAGEWGEVKGFRVRAVDTTGAGDGFAAALLAELAAGDWPPSAEGLRSAVRLANAAGALVTTARGAVAALPDRKKVERFLASRSRRRK